MQTLPSEIPAFQVRHRRVWLGEDRGRLVMRIEGRPSGVLVYRSGEGGYFTVALPKQRFKTLPELAAALLQRARS